MGEEIEFENGLKRSNFRLSWAPDLDLGSGHGHYFFSSLIEYYLYTKFHRNRRNFMWTDGRTDTRTDGNLPPIVLGRLPKFGSRPNYGCWNLTQHHKQTLEQWITLPLFSVSFAILRPCIFAHNVTTWYFMLQSQKNSDECHSSELNLLTMVKNLWTSMFIKTRNTFCGTWYLPHSRVHKSMTTAAILYF